jgi:hypothetical protein
MMKRLGIGLALLLGVTAQAGNEDVILQSKVAQKNVNWLVDKTQIILSNAKVASALSGSAALTDQPKFAME